MNNTNTGGPIFPCKVPTGEIHESGAPEPTRQHYGMTLRDYFAAKAMQAMVGSHWPDSNDRPEIAERSYLMADAMLEARSAT